MSQSAQYWDVFPESIRLSLSLTPQNIPLSIRGEIDTPVFESSNPAIVSVDQSGTLSCGIRSGAAMVMVYADGQRKSVRHVSVEVRNPSWFLNHIDYQSGGAVHISGLVIDAISTQPMYQARVVLQDSVSGAIVLDVLTAQNGSFEADLIEGSYSYEASRDGYITAHGTIGVSESEVIGSRIILSPMLQGQVGRIVLTWGAVPWDLDSHVIGPTPDGNRFHVYYGTPSVAAEADLDVDDTSSYGPETITLHRMNPGMYRYCVHDYSNRDRNPSSVLANSGAVVKIYMQYGGEFAFPVPNEGGTVWTVFEIDGSTGIVTPVNRMSYEENPIVIGQ
jgi:hypothetical protein